MSILTRGVFVTILLQQGLNGIASQFVDPLILRVTVMPFDPNPADFVFRQELVQLLPQIYIFTADFLLLVRQLFFFQLGSHSWTPSITYRLSV